MSQTTNIATTGTTSRLIQLAFLVIVAIAWYAVTAAGAVNRIILPPPGQVMVELFKILTTGEFVRHLLVTLGELCAALAIASVLGLILGYFCSRTRYAVQVFDPLFASLYAVPSILLYPLLILFFGIGPESKIAMGALIAVFPILLATIAGFSSVERVYKTAARSMGASDRHMFFRVLLPAALPVIASGLRIGSIIGTGGILAAETLGSFSGMGHMIVNLADQFQTSRMYAYLIITVIMALAITFSAFAIENRVNRHSA